MSAEELMKLTDGGPLTSGDDNVVTGPGHRLGGPVENLSRPADGERHPSRLAAVLVRLALARNPFRGNTAQES
jgi:hypothetical protein